MTVDNDMEDSYITAYHQQKQQIMIQQEQENMLSTIFEASCEEATPMTSLIDVHQQRTQSSPPVNEYQTELEDKTERPIAPSFNSIDEMPVSTIFSKNESKILIIYIYIYVKTIFIQTFVSPFSRFKIQRICP